MGTPFEALLCSRGVYEAAIWQDGFLRGREWVRDNPSATAYIHEVVGRGLPGAETARLLNMPYNSWHEGLWHGIYGEFEYRRRKG